MRASGTRSYELRRRQPTLFFEFHGSPAGVEEQAEACRRSATSIGGSAVQWATQPEDRTRLWKARHAAYYAALALQARGLASCHRCLRADLAARRLHLETEGRHRGERVRSAPIVGHVGDGNFHCRALRSATTPMSARAPRRLAHDVEHARDRMGGTCTGEHGIGWHKLDVLAQEHGEARRPDARDQARARSAEHHEPRENRALVSYTLYIGNKNYSTWSLRAWVLMRVSGIAFREEHIPLYLADSPALIHQVSPSGRVPCLHDAATVVWDSLAIAEYLAERHPGVWPAATPSAGLGTLGGGRNACRFRPPARGAGDERPLAALPHAFAGRCRRHRAHRRALGRWPRALRAGRRLSLRRVLAADAFFCPVAFRFQTYAVAVEPAAAAYCHALLALPAMREWAVAAARRKPPASGS